MELGQQSFDRKDYSEALRLFKAAMALQPSEDEARAALYNGACAHARLRQWQAAADDVVRAVNEYSLKLEVAAKVRLQHALAPCIYHGITCAPQPYMSAPHTHRIFP